MPSPPDACRPIRVVIVDDHPLVRVGMRHLVEGTEIVVVGEGDRGEQVEGLADTNRPDVMLLDVAMPDCDGLVALERLRKRHPDLPVLMLSAFDNPSFISRAIALRAAGYVLKTASREALLSTIRAAAAGEQSWTRSDTRRRVGALASPRVPLSMETSLTEREHNVLSQITLGQTNKEIAKVLGISCETVKEHVQHILRKLGVSDRTQAAVWAVRHGIVP